MGSGLVELTNIAAELQRKIAFLERKQHESSCEEHHCSLIDRDVDGPEQNVQSTTQGTSPGFAGPTSSDFSFGVAKIILQQEDGADHGRPWLNAELAASVNSDEEGESSEHLQLTTASSPLYGLQLPDILRLLQVYHESVDIFHPVVDLESLQRLASVLFLSRNHTTVNDTTSYSPPAGVDIAHFKMVIAIALLAEGGGFDPLARKIHDDLTPVIANHIMAKTFTLGGQVLLLLTVSGSEPS